MLSLLVFLSTTHLTSAWWCSGHMLVAMIAQLDLLNSNPSAFQEASNIVSVLNGSLSHNLSNSFVESACWADDLKTFNVTSLNNGHFYDMPYNQEGMLDTSLKGANILYAWSNAMNTLTQQTLETAPFETSFSLRFLIHIAGDIHQPLHCTMLWNSNFPNGDLGGNFFKIKYSSDIKQLHAFWDSGAGQLQDDPVRPLNQSEWDYMNSRAEGVMKQWPKELFAEELKLKDPAEWCLGSYLDAKEFVYNGVVQGQEVSQEYLERSWQVIRRRIALAGYRLSDTISSLY